MYETHFHRRNLPHFYRPYSTYFITYRLKGSIPQNVLNELRNRKEFNRDVKSKTDKYKMEKLFFAEYDKILDASNEIQYLNNEEVAEVVKESLHYYDGKNYRLICYTIMPNHVHLIFHLVNNNKTIDKIMQSIKRFSARKSNLILKRKGSFWQSESYDHIVRDEDELERIIEYVIYNPVKAGLVNKWEDWEDWEYTFLAE